MVDHVWGVGNGAEMMIRDHGIGNGHVEFWFRANQYTWNNQQDWGYDAGGGYVGGVFKLNTGGGWHHLGTVHVPTSRNVMMRIVGEGLGWPTTDRTVYVSRATVPAAPILHWANAMSTSTVHVHFTSGGDGGLPITQWEIQYSRDFSSYISSVNADGDDLITGLTSGVTWYFRVRGANSLGWGPLSATKSAFTWRVPDAPTPVTFSNITQTGLVAKFTGGFNGGESVDEWQLAYGLSSNVLDATVVASNGTNTLVGLSPAKTYHFWARGRNAVGWGPWSIVRTQTLRAGAMVKDAGVWKRALPYVKVNGVWRLVKPSVKSAGVWKETS